MNTYLRLFIVLISALSVLPHGNLSSQSIGLNQRRQFNVDTSSLAHIIEPSQCNAAARRMMVLYFRKPWVRDTLSYRETFQIDTLTDDVVRYSARCIQHLINSRDTMSDVSLLTLIKLSFLAEADSTAISIVNELFRKHAQLNHGVSADSYLSWLSSAVVSEFVEAHPTRANLLANLKDGFECNDLSSCARGTWKNNRLRDHLRAIGDFRTASEISDDNIKRGTREFNGKSSFRNGSSFTSTWSFFERHADIMLDSGVKDPSFTFKPLREHLSSINQDTLSPFSSPFKNMYMFLDSMFMLNSNFALSQIDTNMLVDSHGIQVKPPKGKATLYISLPDIGRSLSFSPLKSALTTWNNPAEKVAIARRLYRKYSDRGLEIVWLYQSKGYFRDSPVLEFQEEQKYVRDYLFRYLSAPGNLAMEHTEFVKRHDGMLTPQISDNLYVLMEMQLRSGGILRDIFLIDSERNVVTTPLGNSLNKRSEAVLDALISNLLKEKGML